MRPSKPALAVPLALAATLAAAQLRDTGTAQEQLGRLLAALPENALVVALAGIANHDNMGSIFRNAAAFGADAVVIREDTEVLGDGRVRITGAARPGENVRFQGEEYAAGAVILEQGAAGGVVPASGRNSAIV